MHSALFYWSVLDLHGLENKKNNNQNSFSYIFRHRFALVFMVDSQLFYFAPNSIGFVVIVYSHAYLHLILPRVLQPYPDTEIRYTFKRTVQICFFIKHNCFF